MNLRIDKLLWFLRLAPTRNIARDLAEAGHIRLNGRRVERASTAVRTGDILVLPTRGGVRTVEVLSLPIRRGPASEAQACYRVLDETGHFPIAAQPGQAFTQGDPPP